MRIKFKNIIIIFLCITSLSIIFIGSFFFFVMSGAVFSFMPNPPKPEITYGEFPIVITYEVNGKINVLEDIIVCEFDGFEHHGSGGKRRKWKSCLKSGNERLVLIKGIEQGNAFEISDFYGFPDYYMGDYGYDTKIYEESQKNDNELEYIKWENGVQTGYIVTKDEAFEKYKLKIIDIQYSEPIKNKFK